jgi:hypothetical protein
MTSTRAFSPLVLVIAFLGSSWPAGATDTKMELNAARNARMLDTRFGRYGFLPTRSIVREQSGVRFQLPAQAKGVTETGLYSLFVMAGNFAVSANYELIRWPAPKGGQGMAVGIGIETGSARGDSISLVRGHWPKEGNAFVVVRGAPSTEGTRYTANFYPTQSKRGQLLLRREKTDVIALVADAPGAPLRELCRVPFTGATVRKLRFYADPGGSPTPLDARLSSVTVQAEEVVAGVPKREQRSWSWWWLIGGFFVAGMVLGVAGWFWWNKKE